MNTRPTLLLLAPALLAASVTSTAEAQPAAPARDPAAAEVLFRSALEALDKGDWASACPKFDASMGLDPSVGTLLNVAKCHEHDGKLATAWAELNRALVLNGETAGAQRKQDLERYATGLLAALEPRLPKLTIVVRDKPSGLRVTRDGADVGAAALGVALPVDPGAHAVEASAPGYRTEQRSFSLAEGKAATVELTLLPAPAPPLAPAPAPPLAPAAIQPAAPPAPTGPSPRRVGAFVAGGLGLAAGVVGAVTGGLMLAKKATVSSDCADAPNGVALCKTSAGVDAGNAAKTLGLASSVGWITAVVGLAVGTVLFVTEPRPARPTQGQSGSWMRVGILSASSSGAAFGMEGSF